MYTLFMHVCDCIAHTHHSIALVHEMYYYNIAVRIQKVQETSSILVSITSKFKLKGGNNYRDC